jgi:hypothetical protein
MAKKISNLRGRGQKLWRAVLYSFCRLDQVGKFFQFLIIALYNNYLETIVVVKMNVLGRQYNLLKVVLDVG